MDTLPPEVLRIICTFLNFQDAANVRLLTRSLSIVAAEFLITRICFHTSKDSLARLENVSKHPIFSQTVRVIVYEAALLADVKCRHEYSRHFEHDHHGLERPREPPKTCTPRERRLYDRNKAKWFQNIHRKYENYRNLFDAQKSLIEKNVVENTLARCIPRFPKLTVVDVDPVRRCAHLTSRRFIEEFGSDCFSPLSGNFGKTSEQLRWMLLPGDYIVQSLRQLEINSLSPRFFRDDQRDVLKSAFSHLTDIDIVFKLSDHHDIQSDEHPRDCFHRHLSNGVFKDALAAAVNLEFVSIGFDSTLPIFVDALNILSNTSWSSLKTLGLSTITTTQQNFMKILKRQPKLTNLNLALMQLTEGTWPETLKEMREQLKLKKFVPVGFLEDTMDCWPMDLINVPIYLDDHEEFDLGTAIDLYVTDNDSDGMMSDIDDINPLGEGFGDFEESELVQEMYGTLSDLEDSMSLDYDSDPDSSSMLDSDSDMPDLDTPDTISVSSGNPEMEF